MGNTQSSIDDLKQRQTELERKKGKEYAELWAKWLAMEREKHEEARKMELKEGQESLHTEQLKRENVIRKGMEEQMKAQITREDKRTSEERKTKEINKLRDELTNLKPGDFIEFPEECITLPRKFNVGLFGMTGIGKSSLLKSLEFALKGELPLLTIEQTFTANFQRVQRSNHVVGITKYLTFIDNRGVGAEDFETLDAVNEIIRGIEGISSFVEKVNWRKEYSSQKTPDKKSNLIHCTVLVFDARKPQLLYQTLGKFVKEILEWQGRYPICVITHVDVATLDQLDNMYLLLHSVGMVHTYEVANITSDNMGLSLDHQLNLLRLMKQCINEGDRIFSLRERNERPEVPHAMESERQSEEARQQQVRLERGREETKKDDTDRDVENDDQLTSLKPESGSDRDDISFGGLSAPPEILARGSRAQRAYAEAAKAGRKKVFRTRLMLVGQERVGKTSLKKTLTRQGFDTNEAITDGVETTDTCEIRIEVAKASETMWSIHKKGHENEDNKEDEYNKALADDIAKRLTVNSQQDHVSYEPHSRGLNQEEEDEIAKWLTVTLQQNQDSLEPNSDTTLARGPNTSKAEEFILDNVETPKAKEEDDNMPNQIASLVVKMLKEQVHLKEIGTDRTDSGREEGVSLSIWDFAGHDIYYSTHQVFLTWRAIYVIVFDLSRSLDSVVPPESRDKNYEMVKGGAKSELTCLEFINFWLYSIYAHAVAPSSVINKSTSKTAQKSPPIFIVGTHRESVKGDAQEKREQIGSAFKKIRESIMDRPFQCHVVPEYYAVENSLEDKDDTLVALRRHIERVAMAEPYMGEEIPLRWLLFEEALAAHEINYMSLDQTKELTQSVGMESEHELLTMLTFYHDLGNVVYYGGIEDQQSLLRDMVILNPQWLIDVFKQVITILDPAKRDGIVSDALATLEKDGILEDRLIQHMWQGFLEQKEALVQLMAKFDLICESSVERPQQDGVDTEVSNETDKVVKKRYYVPSRLTSPCPQEEKAQIKSSTDFYLDFRGFLPDGLFHRLMSRAVRWMGERDGEPVTLFHRHISLMVDGVHHALIEMLPPCEATIKVIVYHGAVDDDGEGNTSPAPSAVKEVMDFVTETLDSLIQHWARRINYDVCFLCPRCSRKKRLKDCFKRMSLQCALHNIPTAAIKFKFGMSEKRVESGNESPKSTSSTLPTEGSIAHLVTSDIGIQPLTAARVASEVERILPRINDLPVVPSSSVNIHGNVFNMYVTGRHDLVPPHPMIIPLAVRQELSKLLNGPRVTHDDWTGLASALQLDDYIASLTNKPDPTSDLIDLAERQKKICSLEDLRLILKQMKRDDCVDVLDAGASVESNNRLMIKDRDRSSSSSDDSY